MSVPSWNISRPLQHVPNVDFFHSGVPRELGGTTQIWGTLKNRRSLCPQLQNRVGAYVCAAENVAVVEQQTLGQEGRPHIHQMFSTPYIETDTVLCCVYPIP